MGNATQVVATNIDSLEDMRAAFNNAGISSFEFSQSFVDGGGLNNISVVDYGMLSKASSVAVASVSVRDSVDNIDDAGIDCTREPDWEVVKPTELPQEPGPSQFHNDRYWDERSLDRELEEKDLQEELIQQEMENFNKAAERAEDPSRSFQNEVLDPYYQSGSDPSEPPSAGHSLDSFI